MRRVLILLGALAGVLLVLWGVLWFGLAWQSRERLEAWLAPAPEKDWHGRFAAVDSSGFPLPTRLLIEEAVVVWREGAQEAVWRAPSLGLRIRSWQLDAFDIALPARQTLSVASADSSREFALSLASGRVRVELVDGRFDSLDGELLGADLRLTEPLSTLAADRVVLDLAAAPDRPVWSLSAGLEDVRLPDGLSGHFSGEDLDLSLVLDLHGEPPRGTTARQLAAWRDAGGFVDLRYLRLDWPPLRIRGEGSLALDRALRPEGSVTSEIGGYREALGALRDGGRIGAGQLLFALPVLDAMARPGADGEDRLHLPLRLRDGGIFAGPLRLGSVPPLAAAADAM